MKLSPWSLKKRTSLTSSPSEDPKTSPVMKNTLVRPLPFIPTNTPSPSIDTIPYPSEEEFQFYFYQEEENENRSRYSNSTFMSGEGEPIEGGGFDRAEQRMLIREDKKRCRFSQISTSIYMDSLLNRF